MGESEVVEVEGRNGNYEVRTGSLFVVVSMICCHWTIGGVVGRYL